MHDGMPYGRNQGQGHSREVDRQSPTGLIFGKVTNKEVAVQHLCCESAETTTFRLLFTLPIFPDITPSQVRSRHPKTCMRTMMSDLFFPDRMPFQSSN